MSSFRTAGQKVHRNEEETKDDEESGSGVEELAEGISEMALKGESLRASGFTNDEIDREEQLKFLCISNLIMDEYPKRLRRFLTKRYNNCSFTKLDLGTAESTQKQQYSLKLQTAKILFVHEEVYKFEFKTTLDKPTLRRLQKSAKSGTLTTSILSPCESLGVFPVEEVSKKFKGIELAVINPQKKDEAIFRKMKSGFVNMLLGDRKGFTIVGPASIVKEIKKDPDKIELFTKESKKKK